MPTASRLPAPREATSNRVPVRGPARESRSPTDTASTAPPSNSSNSHKRRPLADRQLGHLLQTLRRQTLPDHSALPVIKEEIDDHQRHLARKNSCHQALKITGCGSSRSKDQVRPRCPQEDPSVQQRSQDTGGEHRVTGAFALGGNTDVAGEDRGGLEVMAADHLEQGGVAVRDDQTAQSACCLYRIQLRRRISDLAP